MSITSKRSESDYYHFLGKKVHNLLREANIEFKNEIEAGDIYFEVRVNNIFILSIDIRSDLTEFFFRDMNFVVMSSENYEAEVLGLVDCMIFGKYEVVISTLYNMNISKKIIFENGSTFFVKSWIASNLIDRVLSKKIITSIEKGKPL